MCREREKKPVGHRIAASISSDGLNGFHNIDIYITPIENRTDRVAQFINYMIHFVAETPEFIFKIVNAKQSNRHGVEL